MKKRKKMPFVEAGSMADIAFLLLIFFLVTTTIQTDTGLSITLPAYVENPETVIIEEDNLLRITVNAQNELLVEKKELQLASLEKRVQKFLLEESEKKKAVVSIACNQGTSYETYLKVFDITKKVYNQIWNKKALDIYGQPYAVLPRELKDNIRQYCPLVISEPELF
jgi:biopolymer transport protein ExbD